MVISLLDWRPARVPLATAPISPTRCASEIAPDCRAWRNSDACARADSSQSTKYRLNATQVSSASRGAALLEPTRFTCAPGRSHLPCKTGVEAEVTVQITSAAAASAASAI